MGDWEFFLRLGAVFLLALVIWALASYSPTRPKPRNPSERMIDPWSDHRP